MPTRKESQKIQTNQLITRPPATVELVIATIKDTEKIHQMQQEVFAELLCKYQDFETNPANEPLERIKWKITQPESYYYYIIVGEAHVGCIRIVDPGEKAPKRISPIFILPQYRGLGYAQAAMLKAEEIHGADNWTLETILQEKGNCYLYEKMGYQQVGQSTCINDKMSLISYQKNRK